MLGAGGEGFVASHRLDISARHGLSLLPGRKDRA